MIKNDYILPKAATVDLPSTYSRIHEYDFVELKYDGILGQVELPDGSVLIGEYMYGSNWAIRNKLEGQIILFDIWRDSSSAMVRRFNLQIRRGKMAKVASDAARKKDAVRIWSRNGQLKYEGAFPKFQITELYPVTEANRLWQRHVVEGDFEGLMYKRNNEAWEGGLGGIGRRKKVVTMDYVIMGFNQSDAPKYVGRMVKSIIGGLYINGVLAEVIDVGGGLNESTRTDMFKNPKRYVKQVMECEGKDVFASGALRHPSFRRLRPDKQASDCRL